MSILGEARKLWRSALPEPVRKFAAPVLNQALEAYVRAAARAPHGAERPQGPIKMVGYFSGSHGIAAWREPGFTSTALGERFIATTGSCRMFPCHNGRWRH